MRKSKWLRDIWYRLSSNQRFTLRRFYYLPIDMWDKILGKRHRYVPPRGIIYTGSSIDSESYIQQGLFQLDLLIEETGLLANDKVLDIGSGVGRTAIALTGYLSKEGSYDGFDVVKKGVDWCNRGIGKDFFNFNFKYVPVFNDLYNTSQLKASEFTFPYRDNSFDKAFSFSLFTHMQIDEIQHYLCEISRVVKKNGTCFSTFFLYDCNDEEYIANRAHFSFPYKGNGFRLMNKNVKSGNIAIDKYELKQMLKKAGLKCLRIIDGFWKKDILDKARKEYQDIVVFKKV